MTIPLTLLSPSINRCQFFIHLSSMWLESWDPSPDGQHVDSAACIFHYFQLWHLLYSGSWSNLCWLGLSSHGLSPSIAIVIGNGNLALYQLISYHHWVTGACPAFWVDELCHPRPPPKIIIAYTLKSYWHFGLPLPHSLNSLRSNCWKGATLCVRTNKC